AKHPPGPRCEMRERTVFAGDRFWPAARTGSEGDVCHVLWSNRDACLRSRIAIETVVFVCFGAQLETERKTFRVGLQRCVRCSRFADLNPTLRSDRLETVKQPRRRI